jgi:hypothetical protein
MVMTTAFQAVYSGSNRFIVSKVPAGAFIFKGVSKMAGFNKSLDKQMFSESVELGNSRMTIAVFSYNNGVPKVQITRENKTAGGEYSFAKLGRMSKDELTTIMPLLQNALDSIGE